LALPDNNDGTGSKRDEELEIYFCGSGFNTDLELGNSNYFFAGKYFRKCMKSPILWKNQ
jgi:hypothetical protein